MKNRELTVKKGMERLPLLNLFPVHQSEIGKKDIIQLVGMIQKVTRSAKVFLRRKVKQDFFSDHRIILAMERLPLLKLLPFHQSDFRKKDIGCTDLNFHGVDRV